MKNKKGFLLSILFVFFICGVTIPLFMTNHKKVKADTITDLTNTTWLINTTPIMRPRQSYWNLSFTSNNTLYTELYIGFNADVDTEDVIVYNSQNIVSPDYVYNDDRGTWTNQAYRTISFTGGTDATNSTLISWLQSNATQQTPTGTEITHRYWAPDGVITMQDNDRIGDSNIQYTILFNQFTDTYTDTTQTGLYFLGVQTEQSPQWSYIESINGNGINLLYHGESNNIDNTMWLEFTIGDYMDDTLYTFMNTWGTWFDDASAYLVGMNQGYVEGVEHGRALGQADGTQYTDLVTGIFNGLGGLLSIQVFPNITIGLLIGLPLLLGAFIIIIKILRG